MKTHTRETWGARAARVNDMAAQSDPGEAFIHHSDDATGRGYNTFAAKANHMRDIQRFHMDSRGWSDIAYHYVVFQPQTNGGSATIFRARNVGYVPAAQLGHNTRTLAICVVGNGDAEEMARNTRFAIEDIIKRYPSVHTIGGHRDVVSTDCPGDHFYSAVPLIAHASNLKRYPHG